MLKRINYTKEEGERMRIYWIATTLVGSIMTAGCASLTYKEPVDGPVASATVSTNVDGSNIGVVSYQGGEYLESKGRSVAVLNSAIPSIPKSDHKTFRVRSGEEFRFSIKSGGTPIQINGYYHSSAPPCMVHVGFVPKADKNYLIKHTASSFPVPDEFVGDYPDGEYAQKLDTKCNVAVLESDGDSWMTVKQVNSYGWCLDPRLSGSDYAKYYCPEGFDFRGADGRYER